MMGDDEGWDQVAAAARRVAAEAVNGGGWVTPQSEAEHRMLDDSPEATARRRADLEREYDRVLGRSRRLRAVG